MDPKHEQKRTALRGLGVLVTAAGGIFTIVGIGNFFSSFGGFEPPKYFWCAFVGLPMLAVGMGLLNSGYMGAVARYHADEIAPVAKDTINYMAEETKDGIRTVAEAIKSGTQGSNGQVIRVVRCHKCNTDNSEDSKFCKNCAEPLVKNRVCKGCGELNDPDAKFCDNCGEKL